MSQTRKIVVDGALPPRMELEPVTAISSLTRWTPINDNIVVDADTYDVVTRDPAGTIIAPSPGSTWPAPERDIGSFTLTYECGWTVTPESAAGAGDAVNEVPASVRHMIERAVAFRAGSGAGRHPPRLVGDGRGRLLQDGSTASRSYQHRSRMVLSTWTVHE